VEMVCDKSDAALARVRKTYPGILTTTDPNEVLNLTQIDAVAVITPVWTIPSCLRVLSERSGS
jgi:predicted dehydrogenase